MLGRANDVGCIWQVRNREVLGDWQEEIGRGRAVADSLCRHCMREKEFQGFTILLKIPWGSNGIQKPTGSAITTLG